MATLKSKSNRRFLKTLRQTAKLMGKTALSRVDKAVNGPAREKPMIDISVGFSLIKSKSNKPLTCRAVEKRRLKAKELWVN